MQWSFSLKHERTKKTDTTVIDKSNPLHDLDGNSKLLIVIYYISNSTYINSNILDFKSNKHPIVIDPMSVNKRPKNRGQAFLKY